MAAYFFIFLDKVGERTGESMEQCLSCERANE